MLGDTGVSFFIGFVITDMIPGGGIESVLSSKLPVSHAVAYSTLTIYVYRCVILLCSGTALLYRNSVIKRDVIWSAALCVLCAVVSLQSGSALSWIILGPTITCCKFITWLSVTELDLLSDASLSVRCVGMVFGTLTRLILSVTIGDYVVVLDGVTCVVYACLYDRIRACDKIRVGFFAYQSIFIKQDEAYRRLDRHAVLRVIADYLICAICLCVVTSMFRGASPGSHHLLSIVAQTRIPNLCGRGMFYGTCLLCGIVFIVRVVTRSIFFRLLEDILLALAAFAVCNRIADRFKRQDVYLGGTYASMVLMFTIPFIGAWR
ncbi:b43.1 [miniopterid betaherpesvirus 1]|uniref:B43.1 n=1 Tax=miniopterid betaherpesvirus 1 TaxID=3070189 RepID=I3VQ28_9BETA|nr:b43.1 [miniopterid betaherpesvirus 1]AFK83872.1 b43.1 [miniopterid betaherpesvirus 1]